MNYFLNRLKEPTTWAALLMVASTFGIELTDKQYFALVALAAALAGTPDATLKQLVRRGK